MKSKLTATVLIMVLTLLMCAIFVSCDNDNAKGYKFSDDMSREEIVEAINSLDNFTYEYYFNDELDQVYYIGNSFNGCRKYYLCLSMKEITLPKTIKLGRMIGSINLGDATTHIIYKGTKAQWEQIPDAVDWCKNTQITVTCSDGDYVVNAE